MSRRKKKKLEKIQCEICGEKDKNTLHFHHINERTELNTTNHEYNLLVVCSNCHNKICHKSEAQSSGSIVIIGIFPSTQMPYGRTVIYEKNGVSNCPGITEPYYKPKIANMRIFDGNKRKD